MKYYKRLKIYKNHNGNNYFNPETLEAISYNWWIYLRRINNKLVFNDYTYSNTTAKHQYQLKKVLSFNGIKPDIYIESPNGLQDLNSSVNLYKTRINDLTNLINAPKSRFKTNQKRQLQIIALQDKIKQINELIGE